MTIRRLFTVRLIALALAGSLGIGCASVPRITRPDYTVQPGDRLRVDVLNYERTGGGGGGAIGLDNESPLGPWRWVLPPANYLVSNDGTVMLPLVGLVKMGGLSPKEIAQRVVKEFKDGQLLSDAKASVTVIGHDGTASHSQSPR